MKPYNLTDQNRDKIQHQIQSGSKNNTMPKCTIYSPEGTPLEIHIGNKLSQDLRKRKLMDAVYVREPRSENISERRATQTLEGTRVSSAHS